MVGGPAPAEPDRLGRGGVVAVREHFSSEFFNRSVLPVKTLMRGIGSALLTLSFLGFTGCSNDNETEAQKLQKGLGAVPETTVKGPEDNTPPPTSQAQRKDPMTQQSDAYKKQMSGKR